MQVEHEVAHALLLQTLEGVHELVDGRCAEVVDAHVADVVGVHVYGVDAMDGNLVACHGEVQRLGDAAAYHTEVDLAALRSAEAAYDSLVLHLHAGDGGVVDGDDAVARQQACLLRRSVRDDLDDHQRVLVHVELDAYALEVALQGFVEAFHLFRVGVGGVRVELTEHLDDGALHDLVFVHRVDIELLDGELGYLQLAGC